MRQRRAARIKDAQVAPEPHDEAASAQSNQTETSSRWGRFSNRVKAKASSLGDIIERQARNASAAAVSAAGKAVTGIEAVVDAINDKSGTYIEIQKLQNNLRAKLAQEKLKDPPAPENADSLISAEALIDELDELLKSQPADKTQHKTKIELKLIEDCQKLLSKHEVTIVAKSDFGSQCNSCPMQNEPID